MRRAVVALAVTLAGFPAGIAGAAAPDAYGYWSKTAPAPGPGVPEGGLYVALGPYTPDPTAPPNPAAPPPPTEPAAVSALRFTVPEGAPATLTLRLAANQSATNPDGTPVSIDACQPDLAAGAWQPPASAPGAFAERPKYNCSAVSVASTVDTAARTVAWNLPGGFQVATGVLDVVLVPTGTVPFQVAFEKPDAGALTASEAPVPPPATEPVPVTETPAGDLGTELAVEAPVSDLGVTASPDVALPTPTSAPRAGTPASRPIITAQPASRPSVPIDDRGDRIFAFSVLVALVVALWWVGGQPVNAPRLLGMLGSRRGSADSPGDAASPAPPAIPVGGVGRFARPRPGRPPRL